ncbi:MAG: SH3 domain-containing protein [Bacteroidetes bacterium]|nr:SH3 domain-containing protein [Bacteroidota bacterium]
MKGLLSKVEYIVIGVLALVFLLWTISKCNAHKQGAQTTAAAEAREDSLANASGKPAATTASPQQPATGQTATATQLAVTTAGETTTAAPAPTQQSQPATTPASKEPQLSKLYVTIDKLKVRKSPGLKGELLGELKLFDEVYYMNEVTDSSYQVNLGKEMANEPYVKIKTKRGTIGWVYGAGVHYVKKKRSGVLE